MNQVGVEVENMLNNMILPANTCKNCNFLGFCKQSFADAADAPLLDYVALTFPSYSVILERVFKINAG